MSGNPSPHAVSFFLSHLEDFFLTYHEHGQHEEQVFFPQIRRFFPQLNPSMDEEHEYEHSIVIPMREAIEKFRAHERERAQQKKPCDPVAVSAVLEVMKTHFTGFGSHLLNHLRNEERSATIVIRKYVTLEQQKGLANECWNVTSIENWERVIPYTVKNLPVPMWKVRRGDHFISLCFSLTLSVSPSLCLSQLFSLSLCLFVRFVSLRPLCGLVQTGQVRELSWLRLLSWAWIVSIGLSFLRRCLRLFLEACLDGDVCINVDSD